MVLAPALSGIFPQDHFATVEPGDGSGAMNAIYSLAEVADEVLSEGM